MSSSKSEASGEAVASSGMSSEEGGSWVRVAGADDLAVGEAIGVEVGDLAIAVYRLSEDEYRATSNICTHAFAYLSEGWFENGEIECPLHAGRFDVRTGRGLCAPITEDLTTYPVKVVDGSVFAMIAPGNGAAAG